MRLNVAVIAIASVQQVNVHEDSRNYALWRVP